MAFKYSEAFYDEMVDTSTASAEVVVPLVLDLAAPRSIIDIGCGEGKWLAVFKKYGLSVHGVDGDWVEPDRLAIAVDEFETIDLERPFSLKRNADVVMTLEVAEHLPAASADGFVASLVALAPVVLFSAAIPLQGGSHHVNEQWPQYWAEKFALHGYVPVDPIRRHIWGDDRVSFFYQQNILAFVKESDLPQYPKLLAEREQGHSRALALVHPYMYSYYAERWRLVVPFLGKLPPGLLHVAKRFLARLRRHRAS